jgi:hypothetical protein
VSHETGEARFGERSATGPGTPTDSEDRRNRLPGVQGEREFTEQRLSWPAGGEMYADRACGLTDASAEFEQARTQSFDLC